MEKNATVLLGEIEETLSLLKERIREIEEQIASLQQEEITEMELEPVPEDIPVQEPVDFTNMEIDVVIPGEAPSVIPEEAPVVPVEPPVILVEAPVIPQDVARLPWRTARPGAPVKHIRSGISLLDRAQFVGTLFKEDADLYSRTLAELDELNNLDEATDYILRHFPDWNLQSDIVYSFMMAVRKRLG